MTALRRPDYVVVVVRAADGGILERAVSWKVIEDRDIFETWFPRFVSELQEWTLFDGPWREVSGLEWRTFPGITEYGRFPLLSWDDLTLGWDRSPPISGADPDGRFV